MPSSITYRSSLIMGMKMDNNELSIVAAQIARFVIERGRVEGEGEDWLGWLGVEVAIEADERGYDNATEIAEEAVRLYRNSGPNPSPSPTQ